ncbi:MAG TPA: regulatory iron-sulfur-containing complex subunit RicT [Thermomicrobiales bacterium]|nr:regulatory iron-sulfur-containing complex subunit RicT [Thermomicrobiales bacterium]
MADLTTALGADPNTPIQPRTLDEARSMARRRFKERLEKGEKIGDCDCHSDESSAVATNGTEPTARVAGVRFVDSGRTYYFDPQHLTVDVGNWVVVESSRGKEAGRVIIAPHQIRLNMLQGELKPILRRLTDDDVQKMERLKRDAATAVKTFGAKIRERRLPMKPISAEYNFDGSHLTLNFSAGDRIDFRDLAKELSSIFHCRVELRQVGPRDEARLLGGLGRCGRTLCCSSWLPIYPEISMNMAKAQDLPLNPGKVSGVCGRLLCCLSYENEQYKQMKAFMPRLGQTVETPAGPGMVVSMQVLKETITVRLAADNTDVVFTSVDLGFRNPEPVTAVAVAPPAPPVESPILTPVDESGEEDEAVPAQATADPAPTSGGRRRRRRGRSRSRGDGPGA